MVSTTGAAAALCDAAADATPDDVERLRAAAALAVLDSEYEAGLSEDACVALIARAVAAPLRERSVLAPRARGGFVVRVVRRDGACRTHPPIGVQHKLF